MEAATASRSVALASCSSCDAAAAVAMAPVCLVDWDALDERGDVVLMADGGLLAVADEASSLRATVDSRKHTPHMAWRKQPQTNAARTSK